MFDLGDRVLMTLIVDAESPDMWSAFGGKTILLTPAEYTALPAGVDVLRISLGGTPMEIPGIRRTVSGELQWLTRPLPDPVVTMFEALPGPGGWQVPASRDVWAAIGQDLLSRGVPPADLIAGYPALFEAARAEVLAAPGPS